MCNFFYFLSNGNGDIWYFNYEQRRNKVSMKDGSKIDSYDSHTSIAHYYGFTGEREDELNKWEYNPFNDELILDTQNTADDGEKVHEVISCIRWNELCGDIKSIKEIIEEAKTIPWFENNEELPCGVNLFETRGDAIRAIPDSRSIKDKILITIWDVARVVRRRDALSALEDILDVVYECDTHCDAGPVAIDDAYLLSAIYLCDGFYIDPEYIEHAKLRWSVWKAGYGVLGDANGVIYAYKRIE